MQATPFAQIFDRALPAAIPPALRTSLAHAAGIPQADQLYRTLQQAGADILPRLLSELSITYRVADRDLAHIPSTGPTLVVANHPHGVLDGAVLASLLLSIRPDVKILANPAVANLPELADLMIPIDPFGDPANSTGLRQALHFLRAGGLLVVFPAGEVSHFQWRSRRICDPPWKATIARLIRIAQRATKNLAILPAFVGGSNSALFQWAGLVHPRLRTALLLRELLKQRGACPQVRIGRKIAAGGLLSAHTDEEAIAYLRWRADLLSERKSFKPQTAWPLRRPKRHHDKIAAPQPPESIARELATLPVLATQGALDAYAAHAHEIPITLAEIARLREVTFREAGEGTGRAEDRDEFDPHYLHLFLWDRERQQIAGAYRLCSTDAGVKGLYTATLFRYDEAFLERLGPAFELGRSFVTKPYQKDFASLLLLWKGIGRIVTHEPRHRTLFGPVSISSEYRPASRQIMASFLRRFAWGDELAQLVSSRHPFVPKVPSLAYDVEDLSAAVSDIEQSPAGVPVLLRQYLKLGGKLLGFSVDPEFSQVMDGLIVVDLTKTDPKLLKRYF